MYEVQYMYEVSMLGKCCKILNTFLFLLSNKMLIFRAFKVRIANREDPDQTSSLELV